jgi:hypothetical protein
LKFYADVHRTKKNSERFRITYTVDGTTFKHVDGFNEIPGTKYSGSRDQIFVETKYSWIRYHQATRTAC